MATGNLLASTANVAQSSFQYDSPSYQVLQSQLGFIGNPLVTTLSSNTALTTGNAVTSVIFRAPANCFVYGTDMTVAIAGSGGATGNVTVFLVAANNGANGDAAFPPGNVQLGNVVVLGTNVAGNVASTGPYSYNLFANGTNSGSNIATVGGFFIPAGSLLVANSTLNVGYVACDTFFRVAANASLPA